MINWQFYSFWGRISQFVLKIPGWNFHGYYECENVIRGHIIIVFLRGELFCYNEAPVSFWTESSISV